MTLVDVVRMPACRRLAVVVSIVSAALNWVPFAFLIGGLLAMYNWDAARQSKDVDRRWYRAWWTGLALAAAGLMYTVWLVPHLATI